jgi:phytoene synthase
MSMPNESALAVLKSKGRSFYFASHLLGPQQRDRAARLYAFCRRVDDLADEASDPQQAYVTLEHLKASLNSSQTDDANVNDMQALMHDVAIPAEPIQALIEGVQSDLCHRQVQDEAELLRYAYQVAGTVGVMMCRVLDVSTPRAWPFAIDLGIAMQLTNIARDVGEDARMGRVYLPQNWVAGLTAKEIQAPTEDQAITIRAAVKRLLAMSQTYYQSGLQGMCFLPRPARYAIVVAASVYAEIGEYVARADYCSWQQRAMVPLSRKLTCATTALSGYALSRKAKPESLVHDAALHQHIQDCFGADQRRSP